MKLKPRGQRKSAPKVFSTNFLDNIIRAKEKCFTPWSDYKTLERKYVRLFRRYQREMTRNDPQAVEICGEEKE